MEVEVKKTKMVWLGFTIPSVDIVDLCIRVANKLNFILKEQEGLFVVQKIPHVTILPPIQVTEDELQLFIDLIAGAIERYKKSMNGEGKIEGMYLESGAHILGKNAVVLKVNTSRSAWSLLINVLEHALVQSIYTQKLTKKELVATIPHVTLGRIKPPQLSSLPDVIKEIAHIQAPKDVNQEHPFSISCLTLFESLGAGEYIQLYSFDL